MLSPVMVYLSKIQVIQRATGSREFYLICPVPVAEALQLQKGEQIEWLIEDRNTLVIRRAVGAPTRSPGR